MATASNFSYQGPVFVDQFLTNYSEKFIQDNSNFIAGSVSTTVPVINQSGQFFKFDRGYYTRDDIEARPLGGAPTQMTLSATSGTYSVEEYAQEYAIDDRVKQNATSGGLIDLQMEAVDALTEKALIRRERKWVSKVLTSGVWSSDWAGVASGPTGNQFVQWNQTAATPFTFIRQRSRAIQLVTGKKPNVLVLSNDVYDTLIQNDEIIDLYRYVEGGLVSEQNLREVFDVERIVVPMASYNTAKEGSANSFAWTAPTKTAWLGYIAPRASLQTPTAVSMFAWQGLLNGVANAQGGVITRGRDDRAYTDWVHIRDAVDFQVVAPVLGTYMSNVIA